MDRRNFLMKSGILMPALVAIPAAIFAASTDVVDVVMIQGASRNNPGVATAGLKTRVIELPCIKVMRLAYTGSKFEIVTTDNKIIKANKIIVNTTCKVDGKDHSLQIKTAEREFKLYHSSHQHPELWSFRAAALSNNHLAAFANRKKSAMLCIS